MAVDVRGDVYAVAKWTGLKAKDVEARLGDSAGLPGVTETKAHIAELLSGTLGRHLAEAEAEHQVRQQPLVEKWAALRRDQRIALRAAQSSRAQDEARQRAQRFRTGT